jgi:hypothetical protein
LADIEENLQNAILKNEKDYNDKLEDLKAIQNENRINTEKKYISKIDKLNKELKENENISNQLIKEMEDKYENDMNEIKQEIETLNMEYNTDIQN